MSLIESLLLTLSAGLLAYIWITHRRLNWPRRPVSQRRRHESYPSVTVVRPIKGLDSGFRENARGALDHGYPGEVETLFVFDDETEPGVPIVREVLSEFRAEHGAVDARILFSGDPPPGRTGKLNAMIAALEQAKGELLAFVDSDTRALPGTLKTLVDTLLSRDDAGSAFAPVVVTEPPRTPGDAGYALLLNALYGPMAGLDARLKGGELPFIMGQFMVLKRRAIDDIGGLESAEGQFVDDMYLGMRLHEKGWRNLVAAQAVPIIQFGLPMSEFLATYVRWITFSRTGLPYSGVKAHGWLRGVAFFMGVILAAVSFANGWLFAAVAAAAVPIAFAASVNELHVVSGGAPLPARVGWMSFALMLVAPWVYSQALLGRQVSWRGRAYKLNASSTLAT